MDEFSRSLVAGIVSGGVMSTVLGFLFQQRATKIEEQIKMQGFLGIPCTGKADPFKFDRARVHVDVKNHLEEWGAHQAARHIEMLKNFSQGRLIMVVSIQHLLLHGSQIVHEAFIRFEVRPDR